MLGSRSLGYFNNIVSCVIYSYLLGYIYIYNFSENYKIYIPCLNKQLDRFNFGIWSGMYEHQKINVLSKFFFIKSFRVIFRGKGYRVRIFRHHKKVTLNFGHSHWTKLKMFLPWYFFKLRRQSYVFLTFDFQGLELFQKEIKSIRKLNRYTQRGLRLKSQVIGRRFGKISQYVSSLH